MLEGSKVHEVIDVLFHLLLIIDYANNDLCSLNHAQTLSMLNQSL